MNIKSSAVIASHPKVRGKFDLNKLRKGKTLTLSPAEPKPVAHDDPQAV